ncbi:hypothetical protein Y032_0224g2718 [Ancylostoma ceylanicum]|uniref:Uncharacterized protein n=1 Tax=Ancylostoma ceylanicum TaxID=53326 RepID=A0A016SH81_9BILA|nr:hypothetical protein Y032_0224g2718 [Ancylostoma ceylanicum]
MAEWCADHLRDVEVGSPSTGDFKFITFLLYVFVSFLFKRILVCSLCDYPTDSLHFVQGTMHVCTVRRACGACASGLLVEVGRSLGTPFISFRLTGSSVQIHLK